MTPTKGSERLRELVSPKMTQEEVAKRLGVTQQAVSSWVQGRTKPTPDRMRELEDLYGIPMRDWTDDPAKAEVA